MSVLDIALLLCVPVGTVVVTVTWKLRKRQLRNRGFRRRKTD